jgi:16S rRNA (guanine966-N2)-methyltransferase
MSSTFYRLDRPRKAERKSRQSGQAKVSHLPRAAAEVPVKKARAEPAGKDQNLQRLLARQARRARRGATALTAATLPRVAKDLGAPAKNRDLVRIVGGRLRGRVLQGPGSNAIRPTSDRLRETLFNILAHSYDNPVEGARAIDLFAGTGAMGIEALSRGARFALFVDERAEACAIVRANIEALDLTDAARILRRDARKLGAALEQERFNLVFLDSPYGKGFVVPALKALRDGGWLDKHALVVIEESAGVNVDLPEGFVSRETRRFGDTQAMFAALD